MDSAQKAHAVTATLFWSLRRPVRAAGAKQKARHSAERRVSAVQGQKWPRVTKSWLQAVEMGW